MPSNVNETNWRDGVCSCPWYHKHYVCKHIIGIALRLKLAKSIPPAAKLIPIDRHRGVGRPANALKALEYQPSVFSSILSEDEDEDENEINKEVATNAVDSENVELMLALQLEAALNCENISSTQIPSQIISSTQIPSTSTDLSTQTVTKAKRGRPPGALNKKGTKKTRKDSE